MPNSAPFPAPASGPSVQGQIIFRLLLLISAYVGTGRLGLAIPYIGSNITLVWLPTGIAVAALARWGWRYWPGIWLGAVLVNLSIGSSWAVAFSISAGNTLGPLTTWWILQKLGFHRAFDRQQDVALFGLAAALGMLLSASGGVASLSLTGQIPDGMAGSAWQTWWMGDTVGILLAGPLLLTISGKSRQALSCRRTELMVWCLLAMLVAWETFVANAGQDNRALPLVFLMLPLVVWAALRFGVTGASLAALTLSAIATAGTASGHGPFFQSDVHQGLMLLWAFMVSLVLMGLLITALQAERDRAEVDIQRLAFFDPLTGLANRRLLHDRLRQAFAKSARQQSHGAVLFIDLDHFKTLNDTQGHDMGDLLLIEVAKRLTGVVREEDTVARLGGDEFVVMLERLGGELLPAAFHVERVAEKIRSALNRPYDLKGHEYCSSPSIGVSLFLAEQKTVDELLKHADIALYRAKRAGRDTIRCFDVAGSSEQENRPAEASGVPVA